VLINVYWHVSSSDYGTTEADARADLYDVTGIPEVDFDAVAEVIGGGALDVLLPIYGPIVEGRLGLETPVTIRSYGMVGETGGWVEAVFKADADIAPTVGSLTAQFVVISNPELPDYPWNVIDQLPPETVTLSSAGDSVVVYRDIAATWPPEYVGDDIDVVVWIEDMNPHEVYNCQIMPDPYQIEFASALFATEIGALESAEYSVTMKNAGNFADEITVELSQVELPDGVDPSEWLAEYREIGGSWTTVPSVHSLEAGESVGFEVRLTDLVGDTVGMALTRLGAQSGNDVEVSENADFATFVGLPSILLVDDDGGDAYETHLRSAMTDTGYASRHWDTEVEGRPSEEQLSSYWAVVWTTGSQLTNLSHDQENIVTYLEGGGNLYLSSCGFLGEGTEPSPFITDYLHVDSWTPNTGGFFMNGVAGDAITDGMQLGLLGGAPIAPGDSDSFVRSAPADTIFYAASGQKGLKVEETGHKLVFTAFPFENVKTTTAYPNNQKTLIARILDWFAAPAAGIDGGSDEFGRLVLRQNFPNPFNPVTKLEFSIPSGVENVSLVVHNVNGQVVRTLVDGRMTAGPHAVVWDGTDEDGKSLSSGVYFARLTADGEKAFTKMTLLK
jgi:hypothetical protein